jgi:hypothetical protein
LNKLTIVIEQERGIFLGNYRENAIFSRNNYINSALAYGFANKKDAEGFIVGKLFHMKDTVIYVEILSENPQFANIVDIIKAGYSEYVEDMFMNMPTEPTIH